MSKHEEFSGQKNENKVNYNFEISLVTKDKKYFKSPDNEVEKKVSYFQLQYRFADKVDYALIIFASIGSLVSGASMPIISLLLGSAINNFGPDVDKTDLSSKVTTLAINYILCGIAILLGSFMMSFFWSIVSKRLIQKINVEYFKVLLKQEQGFFDKGQKNEHFVTKINQEIKLIENGIGIKVGQALMSISQFVASFVVGYITSWQLSLVLTAMLPLLGIGGWFMAKAMDQGQASNESYINAGAMVQEVLKEIKTVASFANFEYEKEKYNSFIDVAMKAGIKQGFKAGFGIGFIVFIVYNSYALAVGYGSYLIANKSTNKNSGSVFGAGEVITVLFSIIFGCFSLGQATPYINAILSACNAAKTLFALLAREPQIDLTTSVLKPDKNTITGRITFKDVCFAYPSKPNELILNKLSISIEPGQKVAIVGESGSGKSTVLSLIERLYDPQSGEIFFDDYNIKNLDLDFLRSLIGYVPQQPVLLNTTIQDNIIFGRKDISDEQVKVAIENSYAKDFVDQKGVNYLCGSGGKMLSGGQKQRIAIARSIVNNPKILIFDEATSALDNKCEKAVQTALDRVCKGLSSITVAHRITTIKNADKILCLDNGKVIEEGTHNELKEKNGFYARLINEYEEDEELEEYEVEEDSFEEDNYEEYNDLKKKNNIEKTDQNEEDIIEYDEEKVEMNKLKEMDFPPSNPESNNFPNKTCNGFNNVRQMNDLPHENIKKLDGHSNIRNNSNDKKICNSNEENIRKFSTTQNLNRNFSDLNNALNIDKALSDNYRFNIDNYVNRMDIEEDKIEKVNLDQKLNNKTYKIEFHTNSNSLKDSSHFNKLNKDITIDENFGIESGVKNPKKDSYVLNHEDISGHFDEKNHKANEDIYSDNNSLNESGFEIKDNLQNINFQKSKTGKVESLLGTSKEKSLKSVRSKGHLESIKPDQELENFNSVKDGYLQINDDIIISQEQKKLKNSEISNNIINSNNQRNNVGHEISNIANNDVHPNSNLNLMNFVSGNSSKMSRGSKKISHAYNENNLQKFGSSQKNLELSSRRNMENVSRGSIKRDSERRSIQSKRRSEKKNNVEEFSLDKENKPIIELKGLDEPDEVKFSNKKFKESRRRLFSILKSSKKFLIGAGISAAFNGAVWPIYGILLADAIGTLSSKDVEDVKNGGLQVAIFFVALALAAALVLWMQNYFFYGIGEILNKEFRVKLFSKFLNLHIGYFENKLNNPLSVLARLSSYTSKIGGVATNVVGQMIQTSVTLILGITLALVYDWRLCLINLCFMPIIIGTYIIQFKVQKGGSNNNLELESEASTVLGETLSNTKTIFAYNMQNYVVDFYSKIVRIINFKGIYKGNILNGILYAFSQFIIFGMYATLFYAGGKFFEAGTVSLKDMMRAILTILFSALGVGIAQAFVGDYSAAQKGIVGLYDFLDEKSLIDVDESNLNGAITSDFQGKIEFKNVKFHYPNMEKNPVFNNLNFVINPGQSAAFVGPSGSGKSTIISLIERFYDIKDGEILIDNKNIKDFNLVFLRKKIGTVLQEPGIFSRSIIDNIKYGKLDASEEEIERAAKKAFIENNLNNTNALGSGGEMQRVAIARAILKNPTILLLDEATSALDANLEEHIKHSLKELMKGRTSIAVAHRLTTIINCDVIFYLENGMIVEQGTHDQLLKLNGKYASLYNQSIS